MNRLPILSKLIIFLMLSLKTLQTIQSLQSIATNISNVCDTVSDDMLSSVRELTSTNSLLIGKGGFGAVYNYKGKAMKIVRLDTLKSKVLTDFIKETKYSKELSDMDDNNEFVPKFIQCLVLGDFVSDNLTRLLTPAVPKKIEGQEGTVKDVSSSAPLEKIVYIAIIMERLQKSLGWFINNFSAQMDLLERTRLGMNLGNHLDFINNIAEKNHCDIKPDNFMLNQNIMKPKSGEAVVSAYSFFFNDFKSYSSKVIDFGGIVPRDLKCTVWTMGFVPFDNLLHNGNHVLPSSDSSKNDVFAFGTILAYILTKNKYLELIKINMVIHSILKEILALINDFYMRQINQNASQFYANLKAGQALNYHRLAIRDITPKIIETLQREDMFSPFKDVWMIITDQANLEDTDFVHQVFSENKYLMAVLEAMYQGYFITIKGERRLAAKFEMMRLMKGFNLTMENYPDYVSDVFEYVAMEETYIDIVHSTFTFDRTNRPEWETLIQGFSDLESNLVKLYAKLVKAAKANNGQGFSGLNFTEFNQFLVQVESKQIILPEELQDPKMRILMKSALKTPDETITPKPKITMVVLDSQTGQKGINAGAQEQVIMAVNNNSQFNTLEVSEMMKKTIQESEFNMEDFLAEKMRLQEQRSENIRII